MINFDEHEYRRDLEDPKRRYAAKLRLEAAISSAPIEQAIDLRKLRTPETVGLLEIVRLRKSGFDMEKKIDGIEESLILAFKARDEHARKYWPNWRPSNE